MRFLAPARGAIDAAVFSRPPLSEWSDFDAWLRVERWPVVDELNARRSSGMEARFVAQTRNLDTGGQLARFAECSDLVALSRAEICIESATGGRDRCGRPEIADARTMRADAFR